jgi:DUF218 domain
MKPTLTFLFLLIATQLLAQPGAGYRADYKPIVSGNWLIDKNFYLISAIGKSPAVKAALAAEPTLKQTLDQRVASIKAHATDTARSATSLVTGFRWTSADSSAMLTAVQGLYDRQPAVFDRLINGQLRPSGAYQRFVGMPNRELWSRAWGQYVVGINYIIDQFGLGKKMRYPRIDSASYPVNGPVYRTVLKDIFAILSVQTDSLTTFYEPSLAVALRLMDANDRDEPARHEPMATTDNRLAVAQIKRTDFKAFPYMVIVVPGSGPSLRTTPVSPDGKIHCDAAALSYKQKKAPFLIVSGGYCYPFQGPYAEAVEMRKYLMQRHGIPESAIIIDPHARHTTTNFRNANRLLIRYGIPTARPSLFVTSKSQTDYVDTPAFDARNQRELGYVPYTAKKRLSMHEISYVPVMECLHLDPFDPLDP